MPKFIRLEQSPKDDEEQVVFRVNAEHVRGYVNVEDGTVIYLDFPVPDSEGKPTNRVFSTTKAYQIDNQFARLNDAP